MKSIIKIIGRNFYKYQFIVLLILFVQTLSIFFESLYLKKFLDNFAQGSLRILPIFILTTVIRITINLINILILKRLNITIAETIPNYLVRKFLKSKWNNVYNNNPSDTQHLINNDANVILPLLVSYFPHLIVDLVTTITFTIYLATLNVLILPLVIMSLATSYLISARINGILKLESIEQRKHHVSKMDCLAMIHTNFSFIFANNLSKK